jgi:hypothetical protein
MVGFTALIVFQEGDAVEVRMRHAIRFGPLVHQALLEQVATGHAAMNKAETVHYVVIGPWFLRACAPSSIAAPMSCSAMPQPAELPPGMTTRCCGIGLPEVGTLESSVPTTTAAVPCTLSLNIQCWSRQRSRDRVAWYDGEIFRLRQNLWLSPFHGGDEGIDEGLILRPFDARMTPTEIERIVEPPLIFGSDIKCDRRRSLGRDAATAGIERELADGDARAARALVAEAKNVRPPSVTTIVRTSRSPTASSISSMRSRSG